ncbi:leucine-rich repeat domain protein [Naegleria gruberi]|uniref:Leucine-rich repeat domain protein n=1 Tax=Naegleria gruberi TaxID=5762 RepID=D2VTZ3_NAEGR|nr:leucine-rich repeat domain protein [Naegleria gruberi]EFC39743.1 leucine-rich repeat domain protein [Naegleria gruberi]|eukprot:XP_002672487.1 leucine-rich repeat domain protein [Naegleria gruberi strain NEG-M]
MKRKQGFVADGANSEKRRKQTSSKKELNTDGDQVLMKTLLKANLNEDVLGVIFDFLDYSFLSRKCRFVCLQWNEAFCNMPVLSSHISAPLTDFFARKANEGELYMIRDLSLEGISKDFDFSLLYNLEKLSLRSQGHTMVPDSIQCLPKLKSLQLFKFIITATHIESWTKLPKLEELSVKHNPEFFEFSAYHDFSNVKKLELCIKNEDYLDYSVIINGKISKNLTHFTLLLSHGSISIVEPLPKLTFLKLSYCDIKKVDAICIPLLSEITFDAAFTDDDSAICILKAPLLKKAALKSDYLDEKCAMMSSTHIEDLELDDLDNDPVFSIFNPKFSALKRLSVPNSFIGNRNDFSMFKNLTELNVNETKIGNKVLLAISKMTQLTSLNIGKNDITKNVFKHLKKLDNLTALDLEDCGVKDITPLAKLTKITKLNLKNNYLKGEWLQKLVSYLPNLRKLNSEGNELTSLAPLSLLTNIQKLKLKSLKFSDIKEMQLQHLLKLEYLDKLSITSMDIGEEGAKILGRGRFKHLKLNICELHDRALPFILTNTSLRTLDLQKNNLTEKGVNIISKSYLPFMQKVNVSENKYYASIEEDDSKFQIVNKNARPLPFRVIFF